MESPRGSKRERLSVRDRKRSARVCEGGERVGESETHS